MWRHTGKRDRWNWELELERDSPLPGQEVVPGMWTPAQRLYTALSNRAPDRVPVVPKIFVDSAARLTGTPMPSR